MFRFSFTDMSWFEFWHIKHSRERRINCINFFVATDLSLIYSLHSILAVENWGKNGKKREIRMSLLLIEFEEKIVPCFAVTVKYNLRRNYWSALRLMNANFNQLTNDFTKATRFCWWANLISCSKIHFAMKTIHWLEGGEIVSLTIWNEFSKRYTYRNKL